MSILEKLFSGNDKGHNFLIGNGIAPLCLSDVFEQETSWLSQIPEGSVVALVGDFDAITIKIFLELINLKCIVIPLVNETKNYHEFYFEVTQAEWLISGSRVEQLKGNGKHNLYDSLRRERIPGLILFSTGSTGQQKAILHNFDFFLSRFFVKRPTLRTLSFLQFDHIGGINTLFHTMANGGVLIKPASRAPNVVLETIKEFNVEVLPTTPTFLRYLLFSGLLPKGIPDSLKIITYGTERMDEDTLKRYSNQLPNIDFRQTYGMTELGIMRVKSKSRNSLFMKIGGDGVETKINEKNELLIRSDTRMLGYLNSPSPFDKNGWYQTGDIVEQVDDYLRIVGRNNEVINVGGLKFLASEIEAVALQFPNVQFVKVNVMENQLTGQHVEISVQVDITDFDIENYRDFLREKFQKHMMPRRIKLEEVPHNHRFKKS